MKEGQRENYLERWTDESIDKLRFNDDDKGALKLVGSWLRKLPDDILEEAFIKPNRSPGEILKF